MCLTVGHDYFLSYLSNSSYMLFCSTVVYAGRLFYFWMFFSCKPFMSQLQNSDYFTLHALWRLFNKQVGDKVSLSFYAV